MIPRPATPATIKGKAADSPLAPAGLSRLNVINESVSGST